MADVLAPVRVGFFERIRVSTPVARVVARAPRWAIMLAIAALPPLVFFAFLLVAPAGTMLTVTDAARVHGVFASVIAGLITAATIAVSVSAFTLRGDLKDFARFRSEQRSKEDFRDELRELLETDAAPLLLSELVAETLEAASGKARAIRADAGDTLHVDASGASLEEYLHVVETRAKLVARRVRASRARPDVLHLAVLDMEHELVLALARRFLRHARVSGATRDRLEELHALLRRLQILVRYTKKLDLEWGLSRMSYAMLATTIPAVMLACFMALSYNEGVVAAMGLLGAAAFICVVLAIVLLPLGAFASYLVRFVFLNQHTLAHDGFVLGPEEPDAAVARDRPKGQTAQMP